MLIFLISVIICILMHETAHLIVAKMCGCKVEAFSIGFGKPALKKKFGSTIYQITPWILGGFCKLKGELEVSKDKDAFVNLTYSNKVAISVAGCVINILTGLICIMISDYGYIYSLYYFGMINVLLGLTNLVPFPALDGSYPFLVLLEKKMGKERGYTRMRKLCNIGFITIMILNIMCIPLLIYYIMIGAI